MIALLPDRPGLSTFGAPKGNYDSPIDPETDLADTEYNALAATAAAAALTLPRCVVTVASDGTLTGYRVVWSDVLAPATARRSAGVYTITFAAEYPDLLDGDLRAFAPFTATGSSNSAGAVWQRATVTGSVVTVTLSGDGSFTAVIY